ncbi:MAG TPA: bifunctional serine/threonine-protein kinase/formylglycine-generating enzyme family protein [Anaerolineaceae bacterium]|nr:bifunctional serine/threonine-protein kinase/formylglycine-generating enzyme family protein [Anaerolineaceae bacterium]
MPIFAPGDIVLQDYQIEAFIGEGSFGEVYRALDLNLRLPVALKILRRTSDMDPGFYERARERFMLEAWLGHHITQANVVRVYKFAPDEASGLLVLVMEYISGGSLADRLKSGPLEVGEALGIARQVAAGLDALHARDVVHRDLKPSNILIDVDGSVRVADLGLAQTANAQPSSGSGSGSSRVWQSSPGTPAYMSPEQEGGRLHLPPAADIYALGLILFEMLTGRSYKIQPPGTRANRLQPAVPAGVADLVVKMLSEDPRQRPWTGAEAEAALGKLEESWRRSKLPGRNSCRLVGILGGIGLLLALVVGVVGILISTLGPPPGPDPISAVTASPVSLRLPSATLAGSAAAPIQEPIATPTNPPRPTPTRSPTATTNPLIPPACQEVGQTWTSPADGMMLVCVPAGDFLMGSTTANGDADDDEKPQHTVYLDAYWLDRTEVTNAMFAEFVAATGYVTTAEKEGSGSVDPGGGFVSISAADWRHPAGPGSHLDGKMDHPVVQVSWYDAQAYCSWAGRQLPSEAQWEKAARGTDGRLYPWGNQPPTSNLLNYNWTVGTTTAVGAYPNGRSVYGALDMAGNVWEWTADWYGGTYYSSQTTWQNPVGPGSGDLRVVRSVSWYDGPFYARVAYRGGEEPDSRDFLQGFRCLLR